MVDSLIENPVKKPAQQKLFLDERDLLNLKHEEEKRIHVSRPGSTPKKSLKIYDCTSCGLSAQCNSPKMVPFGEGKKGILIVALCPGEMEDDVGQPLVGKSGKLARRAFNIAGINMDEDCIRTNVVICRPEHSKEGGIKQPTNDQIRSCYPNLVQTIQEVKPKLIICLGREAVQGVLKTKWLGNLSAFQMQGRVVPSLEYNCWVGCTVHPSYVLHRENDELGSEAEKFLFFCDVAKFITYLDKKPIKPLSREEGNELVLDSNRAIELLRKFRTTEVPVSFDYETTGRDPFQKDAAILTVSLSTCPAKGYCIPLQYGNWNSVEQALIEEEFVKFLKSNVPKVAQYFNFEGLWSQVFYKTLPKNLVHDTIVGQHVINCVQGVVDLGFQVFEVTGAEYKGMVDTANLRTTPLEQIGPYNSLDSRYTSMLRLIQISKFDEHTGPFNDLLVRALPTLSKMSYRGVKVDVERLQEFQVEVKKDMISQVSKIRELEGVSKLEKKDDREFSPSNDHQIEELVYDIYKHPCKHTTKTGRGVVDREVLEEIRNKAKSRELSIFIKMLQEYGNLESFAKVVNNYLDLVDDNGYVHPMYNLHRARSFRSSASDPNIMNVPKRDEKLAKFRSCIIPPEEMLLVEVDYSGCEVRVIAMASGDRKLAQEIKDGIDTHRKWAAYIYEKNEKDVTKDERFRAKNGFVFASFYGARADNIARNFNMPFRHIRDVQNKFWSDYKEVKVWQEANIEFYKRNGYIRAMSGFRRPAPLTINKILNTPIQGPAFHLSLDGLTRIDHEIEKRDLKSWLCFEIHDSAGFYMYPEELEEMVVLSSDILKSKRFEWQKDIPLEVEWSKSEKNWLEMENFNYKKFM